jgi:O-antigen ligase
VAFKGVCLRLATLLFPLSVVLYKYYPQWGRDYGQGGVAMITGVTPQKNSLGEICCIFGFVLLWDMLDAYRSRGRTSVWKVLGPKLIVFGIGMWLLIACQSKTSLLAFLIGTATFFGTRVGLIRRCASLFAKFVFVMTCVGLVVSALWTFAIAPLLEAVGRDATFTERTMIWELALKQDINPLLGTGFFSFWAAKGPAVWAEIEGRFRPRTVHSGYLETYLDGGWIGGTLLGVFLLFTGWRCARNFSAASTFSRALLALTLMALVINFSETNYFRLSPMWFSLVLAALASHPAMYPRTVIAKETAPRNELQPAFQTAA